jgi:hypothetical protein
MIIPTTPFLTFPSMGRGRSYLTFKADGLIPPSPLRGGPGRGSLASITGAG